MAGGGPRQSLSGGYVSQHDLHAHDCDTDQLASAAESTAMRALQTWAVMAATDGQLCMCPAQGPHVAVVCMQGILSSSCRRWCCAMWSASKALLAWPQLWRRWVCRASSTSTAYSALGAAAHPPTGTRLRPAPSQISLPFDIAGRKAVSLRHLDAITECMTCQSQDTKTAAAAQELRMPMQPMLSAAVARLQTAARDVTRPPQLPEVPLSCRVGLALIKGDWEAAVRLILAPSEHDKPEVVAARRTYLDQGDAATALHAMPRFCSAECAILQVPCISHVLDTAQLSFVHAHGQHHLRLSVCRRESCL